MLAGRNDELTSVQFLLAAIFIVGTRGFRRFDGSFCSPKDTK